MIIDDKKTITPFHIVNNRTIYSDHCSIIIKMNWYIASRTKEENYCMVRNKRSFQNLNLYKIEEAKIRVNTIENEIAKIEKDGRLNSTAFWEFKKRMDKKGKQK